MSSARLLIATVFDGLASLPDASVDLVLTSPPYVALRSYLPADHPTKAKEIGSEPTPGAFIDTMLDVVEALDRVLAPHGSICIELGDTYSGSGGAGGDWIEGSGKLVYKRGAELPDFSAMPQRKGNGWPLAKSLAMVPESFRWALAYGRNPFTGRETPPWRVRNVVRHFRPNPPVGALGDKVRPATSDWVVATKSRTRFFDLDAVRTPNARIDERTTTQNPAGAPPLDWWADDDLEWRDAAGFVEPTFGYKGAHFATFSPSVVARLIKPMCPQRVCRTCGEPSRRIVGDAEYVTARDGKPMERLSWMSGERNAKAPTGSDNGGLRVAPTLGWTDCSHNDYRPGLVFDPFAGSGTTLQVATGHGYDAVGLDLDSRNAALARERVGMWLTVEHLEAASA